MTTFSQVSSALRRNNRKNYGLLCGCCFFSVLLVTAYVSMMHSPYNPPGASGGRRQRTGNDDLCLSCHRLRCICHLCRRPFLLAEVPGNRRVSGSGRLPKATETGTTSGSGRYFPGFLRHRGYPGHPFGLGAVAGVPGSGGGYKGDATHLQTPTPWPSLPVQLTCSSFWEAGLAVGPASSM